MNRTGLICRSTILLLTSLSLALLSCRAHAQKRRALLIGINNYIVGSSPKAAEYYRSLRGAVNDVNAMHDMLVTPRWGFDQNRPNMVVLRNAEATKAKILGELEAMIARSERGDILLFYYAGHGDLVTNSKSDEPSKLDQTIVPADAPLHMTEKSPANRHIRDKELRIRFDKALDRGILLTCIFDSCHSGDLQRGDPGEVFRLVSRDGKPDPADIAEAPLPGLIPAERGALFLSACQDYELAGEFKDNHGVPHGRFTSALIDMLTTSAPNKPVDLLLQPLTARVQGEGGYQQPVLAALPARRAKPLLGGTSGNRSHQTLVAVRRIVETQIELQGGTDISLGEGCELIKEDNRALRVKITKVMGLNLSTAKLVSGKLSSLRPGTLLKLDRWVVPGDALLRVWMPPANLSLAQLRQAASALAPLQLDPRIHWIQDPYASTEPVQDGASSTSKLFVLSWNGAEWQLSQQRGAESSTSAPLKLGVNPSAEKVLNLLPANEGRPLDFMIQMPLPSELAHNLPLGKGTDNEAIEIVSSVSKANYVLLGRVNGGELAYSWISQRSLQGNMEMKKAQQNPPQKGVIYKIAGTSMPARTDWIVIPDDPGMIKDAGEALLEHVLRLARIQGWLILKTPPDNSIFPFKLVVQDAKNKKTITEGSINRRAQFDYSLCLQLQPSMWQKGQVIAQRYVYVFALDEHGTSTLLFPRPELGGQNRLPYLHEEMLNPPATIPLQKTNFNPSEPFGHDTYILLTSAQSLGDPTVLEADGVLGKRAGPRGNSPLEQLLNGVSSSKRSPELPVPVEWSIQYLSLISTPPLP